MTLDINLTDEEQDALTAVVAARNAASGTSVTAEQHLSEVVQVALNEYTAAAYEQSVRDLGAAARGLPYEERKQITAAVRAQVAAQNPE